MSNFWSVLGAAAGATCGAIVDELERENRPRVSVRFVERPVHVRVSAPVETVRIVDNTDSDDLRGRVYKTYGFCPDYYVVVRENLDGTVKLARILSAHGTMPMSKKTVSMHQLRNDFVFVREMDLEEFSAFVRWL